MPTPAAEKAATRLSRAAAAVSNGSRSIEGVQNQMTQGVMTGNAPMTRNPLNDALAAGLRAGANRMGRRSAGDAAGERAARAAGGVGEQVRQAREVPITQGGRDAPAGHGGPSPATGAEPPVDRNRDRGGNQR